MEGRVVSAERGPLRVLLVEDNEDDAILLVRELRRAGWRPDWARVETEEELRRALVGPPWDIIIADHSLPRYSGLSALRLVRESGSDVPFLVVSGTIDEELAVELMRAGAQDYIMKGNLARLLPAIEREIEEAGERRRRRRAEEALGVEADVSGALVRVADVMITSPDETELLQQLCRAATEVLSSSSSHIFLLDPRADSFTAIAAWPQDDRTDDRSLSLARNRLAGMLGILERKGVVQLSGAEGKALPAGGLRASLGVPTVLCMALWRGNEIVGFQTAERATADGFDEHRRRVAEGLARIGSMALDRVRVAAELRERQQELALLRAAAEAANRAERLEEVLRETVRALCLIGGWPVAFGWAKGQNSAEGLSLATHFSEPPEEFEAWLATLPKHTYPEVGLAGVALASRRLVHSNDLRLELAGVRCNPAAVGLRSGMAAPVLLRGEVVAVIEVFGRRLLPEGDPMFRLLPDVARQVAHVAEREAASQEIARLNADLRARLQERTGELERARGELEVFRQSISHDLRDPLGRIDGFSQLVLEDAGERLDDQARHYLERARVTAHQMENLVDGLLEHSEAGRVELHPTDLNLADLAREVVVELQRAEPQRRVRLRVADDLFVRADPRALRIVLQKLLANAWKFTCQVGEAEIEVGVVERDGEVTCFVRDNGVGFDPAFAHKLFQPFQRLHSSREFPGSGMGLAIVRRLVERHGGRVWADASPGRGATFYFTLPQA